MNERSFAMEVSFLELHISSASEPMKTWLRGLLERFKEFAKNG